MSVRITPPLQAKGRFVLRAPFIAEPTTIYLCIALRKFRDIEEVGGNVYKDYYSPMGILEEAYREDADVSAAIVTLVDPYGNKIYVPDTYIASYPNMGEVEYHHVVLAASIGAIPNYVPLDNVIQGIAGIVSDMTGTEPTVSIHAATAREQPTAEQHELAEAARAAAITLRVTDRALYLQEKDKNFILTEENKLLVSLLQANGLLN